MAIKIWKTHSVNDFILKTLKKKAAITEKELFTSFSKEFKDLGYKDFNKLLMNLEIAGKLRTTSMKRGKRRIELVSRE